jgi:hypothetical protein
VSKRALSRSLVRAATEAQEAAAHTVTTLGVRLPMFAEHAVNPTAASAAEWSRAYSEKVAATWDGAVAASLAFNPLFWFGGRPPSPAAAVTECLRVMSKAGAPARKKVKANATRLRRRKKR